MKNKFLVGLAVLALGITFIAKCTDDRYFIEYDMVGGEAGQIKEVKPNDPLVEAPIGKPVLVSVRLKTIEMVTQGTPNPRLDWEQIIVRKVTHQWF